MASDLFSILIWWLIAQVLGWLAMPTAMRIFRWLPDRGYAFSKALGLLLASYLLWVGATAGFLRNDLGGAIFAMLGVGGVSAWFYFRRGGDEQGLGEFLQQNKRLVITAEVLFALGFVAWALLRAYAPDKIMSSGGEKFMEIAFLNGTLRSGHFPPLDPWLSGFAISYYYFGYVMMAFMTRFSGLPAGVAFDLYDALLFALTAMGTLGVVYNLVAASLTRHPGRAGAPDSSPALASGLLGALLVALMGNLQGVWEALRGRGILPDTFWAWLDVPGLAQAPVTGSWLPGADLGWWWWRASRVVGDRDLLGNPAFTQPIDEFPFFSFLLGDNHPHVLALPFVLLCIGLALNLLLRQSQAAPEEERLSLAYWRNWLNPARLALGGDWVLFLFSALILGSLGFLNTWDLPIYLGLVLAAHALGSAYARRRLDGDTLLRTLLLGFWLGIASLGLYLFFYAGFGSQAGGILPYILPPTRLQQYLTMFGTFILLQACFAGAYLSRLGQEAVGRSLARIWLGWWLKVLLVCALLFGLGWLLLAGLDALGADALAGLTHHPVVGMLVGNLSLGQAFRLSLAARLGDPWLMLFISFFLALAATIVQGILQRAGAAAESQPALPAPELFAFLLVFAGLGLTLVVEFVYLRDNFGARMNTLFKFYYQAWVMLGIASAYGTWWLVSHLRRRVGRTAFAGLAAVVIAAGMLYPVMAIPSRAGNFQGQADLDGASSVARGNPDDWAAIQWLNSNVTGTPVILEAPGYSYNYEGRISAFTGFPAVLGWAVHESQWRGNYDEQSLREPDIATIYTASNGQATLDLLHKWNVDYVILGSPERDYIQKVCNQPGQSCTLSLALRKFDLLLEPVFSQGQVTIYSVP